MKGKIKAFPVTGRIKPKTMIQTPDGEVKRVMDVQDTTVTCEDETVYNINEVILVKKYVVNNYRRVELHFSNYQEEIGKTVDVITKESLVNGFIGDEVKLFKLSADIISDLPEYIKIEPVVAVIIDIADNLYEVETVYGKRYKVRRHYFELISRNDKKTIGKIKELNAEI